MIKRLKVRSCQLGRKRRLKTILLLVAGLSILSCGSQIKISPHASVVLPHECEEYKKNDIEVFNSKTVGDQIYGTINAIKLDLHLNNLESCIEMLLN